jgi:hypothetical protein
VKPRRRGSPIVQEEKYREGKACGNGDGDDDDEDDNCAYLRAITTKIRKCGT